MEVGESEGKQAGKRTRRPDGGRDHDRHMFFPGRETKDEESSSGHDGEETTWLA